MDKYDKVITEINVPTHDLQIKSVQVFINKAHACFIIYKLFDKS